MLVRILHIAVFQFTEPPRIRTRTDDERNPVFEDWGRRHLVELVIDDIHQLLRERRAHAGKVGDFELVDLQIVNEGEERYHVPLVFVLVSLVLLRDDDMRVFRVRHFGREHVIRIRIRAVIMAADRDLHFLLHVRLRLIHVARIAERRDKDHAFPIGIRDAQIGRERPAVCDRKSN